MYPQSPTTVVIYKDFFAVCADDNSRLHEVTYEWVGPGDFDYYKWRILQIINVVEEDAGLYTCTATSTATGEFASASITLIVQSELMVLLMCITSVIAIQWSRNEGPWPPNFLKVGLGPPTF